MKTIFKNERGVPTLHIEPETDTEREQLRNVVCKSPAERLYLPRQLKIRKTEGGGISVSKIATLNESILFNAWVFGRVEVGPKQFKGGLNFIFISQLYPNTIIVGNGTYRVYRNVDDYIIDKETGQFDIVALSPEKPVKKFVCRTVDEMTQALAWVQPTKK